MIKKHAEWWVYVLLCENGSLYTGIAKDPEERFVRHIEGKGAKYTRAHKPVRIIYREEVSSRGDALRRESEIKNWKRTEKIKRLGLVVGGG